MLLTESDLQALWLTVRLATVTTVILFLVGTPLAWWLSQTQSRWRGPVGALVLLPLVLPPTVLGFYILVLLGPQGWVGAWTQAMGWGVLSFSFGGLLIGSVIAENFGLRAALFAGAAGIILGPLPLLASGIARVHAQPAHTEG